MVDIKRFRQRPALERGMGALTEFSEAAVMRRIQELQTGLEDLAQKVAGITSTTTEITRVETDPDLERRIREIETGAKKILRWIETVKRYIPPLRTARIVAVQADHLECTWFAPETDYDGVAVNIAKPWRLRQTPMDGNSLDYDDGSTIAYTYTTYRERTATEGAVSETQVVTPDYIVDTTNPEEIPVIYGPTSVVVDGIRLMWSDHSAGREWAKE